MVAVNLFALEHEVITLQISQHSTRRFVWCEKHLESSAFC